MRLSMQVFAGIGALLVASLVSSCGKQQQDAGDSSDLKHFFANSSRRDAKGDESKQVARISGCTVYYVENTAGKVIMGTARHCTQYSITNWCNNKGQIVSNDGKRGVCKRIVAADTTHDIAFFEADFGTDLPAMVPLRLAAFAPPVSTRLLMLGYPADQYRQGKLTATENCWVLGNGQKSPHGDSRLGDRSGRHNCSTYGGNSGGPMIIEGTNIAMALPFTYLPGDYNKYPGESASGAAYFAEMADFVRIHAKELEQDQVVLATQAL